MVVMFGRSVFGCEKRLEWCWERVELTAAEPVFDCLCGVVFVAAWMELRGAGTQCVFGAALWPHWGIEHTNSQGIVHLCPGPAAHISSVHEERRRNDGIQRR